MNILNHITAQITIMKYDYMKPYHYVQKMIISI